MGGSISETDLALLHTSVRAVTLTYGIRLWNTIHHHLTLTHTHFCHISLTQLTSLHLHPGLKLGSRIRPKLHLLLWKNGICISKKIKKECRNEPWAVHNSVFTCLCPLDNGAIDKYWVMSLNISETKKTTEMESACPFGNGNCVWHTAWSFF